MKLSRLFIFILIVSIFSSCGGDSPSPGGNNGNNGDDNNNKPGDNTSNVTVKVGDVLPDWQEGELDIHSINTGRGESTLFIFPDGTSMLVDAAGSLLSSDDEIPPTDAKPNKSITSGKVISNYLMHFLPKNNKKIDYMMVSHFHGDHIGSYSSSLATAPSGTYKLTSIAEVCTNVPVGTFIDRGYTFPKNMTVDNNIVTNYLKMISWSKINNGSSYEQFNVGVSDQITLKHNKSKYQDFNIRNLMANGVVWTGVGTETRNTMPSNQEVIDATFDENISSIAFFLTYGDFNYFAGGDLQFNGRTAYPWKDVESAVAPVVSKVEVMKADHHATSNTNTDALLNKLRPDVVVANPWRDVQPNIDTIKRFYAANSSCHIFLTNLTQANAARLSSYTAKFGATSGHIVIRVRPDFSYSVYALDDTNENYKVAKISGPFKSSK